MSAPATDDPALDDPALDYAFLRKVVGLIAVALPVVVVVMKGVLDGNWALERSISSYYYTHARNWFVGSLCALAVFLLSYDHGETGTYRTDNRLSTAAAVSALAVAFLPTTRVSTATTAEKVVGTLHLVAAGLLFALLGVLAEFFFTRSDPLSPPTSQKVRRNVVYRVCGGVIFACLALAGVTEIVRPARGLHALFWLEAVMVWAFGISWLVKGGFLAILADPPAPTGAAQAHRTG